MTLFKVLMTTAMLALAVLASPRAIATAARKARIPHAKKVVAVVNSDDPNLAFSPDYASDTATSCPKTLKGRKLRACLVKNGLIAGEEFSEGNELLSDVSPRSLH